MYELLKSLEIAAGYEPKDLEKAKLLALSISDWAHYQTCNDTKLDTEARKALEWRR